MEQISMQQKYVKHTVKELTIIWKIENRSYYFLFIYI